MLGEIKLHNEGFVRLLSVYGTDQTVEESARISYSNAEKRNVSDTKTLLRYLMRHQHTSVFEMVEARFHIRLPIFIMRQLVRHRTANLNEISGRYSELPTEFYIPVEFNKQSKTNKQGADKTMVPAVAHDLVTQYEDGLEVCADIYQSLLSEDVAKEQARYILPVSTYTECIWKMDLNNLFRFLKLRTDSHAQKEMQDYANAIEQLTKPHFPICFEAYEDYIKNAVTFSHMEMKILLDYIHDFEVDALLAQNIKPSILSKIENSTILSNREKTEFKNKLIKE